MLFFMGALALFALWFVFGILRDEHKKSQREVREIERATRLDRDFARVVREGMDEG